MKKQLFWTAVIYHNGKKTELVLEPVAALYKDEAQARRTAIKAIPTEHKDRFDRLEVLVRPF